VIKGPSLRGRDSLFQQCEKQHEGHQRQADQQGVMAPPGYHSKHFPLLNLLVSSTAKSPPAAHVLYGGETVHFQLDSKDVAGLKTRQFRRFRVEIALLGPPPGA
jgi:hypothetical protein